MLFIVLVLVGSIMFVAMENCLENILIFAILGFRDIVGNIHVSPMKVDAVPQCMEILNRK
jgi:hypothetical protein